MEERKHLFDYLGQIFMIFGITMAVVTAICAVVGDEAKGYSSMFAFGSGGVPVRTVFQFLLSSVCITALRVLFFTDILIKKMSVVKRTVSMVALVILLIGVFAALFGWFPVDDPKCWAACLISFAICFTISASLSVLKERMENKRLAEGLQQIKEESYGNVDGNT